MRGRRGDLTELPSGVFVVDEVGGPAGGPAELVRIVPNPPSWVGGLPQLLRQLHDWLTTERNAGRIRPDNHMTWSAPIGSGFGDSARGRPRRLLPAPGQPFSRLRLTSSVVSILAAVNGLVAAFGAWAISPMLLPEYDLAMAGPDDWRHVASVALVCSIAP